MLKAKHVKNTVTGLEYLLFFMNIAIAFRMLVLYINLNMFIDYETGKMNFIGQNIKFFQTIVVSITEPIINPFRNLLTNLMGQENSGFADVLAPGFSIVVVLLVITVLKISSPYILKFISKYESDN